MYVPTRGMSDEVNSLHVEVNWTRLRSVILLSEVKTELIVCTILFIHIWIIKKIYIYIHNIYSVFNLLHSPLSPALRFKISLSDSFVGTVFSSIMLFMSISGRWYSLVSGVPPRVIIC